MINHHALFTDIFDRTIKVNYKNTDYLVNFTEGDLFELWKVLQSKKQKYPVIWLQSGYKVVQDIRGVKTNLIGLQFFFITKGSVNDYNQKRFVDTFQDLLYPLFNQFLEKIRSINGLRFGRDEYSFISLPFNDVDELSARERDYGNKRITQTTTTQDIWDAIALNISLTIDNECSYIKKFKMN